MYILNPCLSEDDVKLLHDSNLLKRLASCSGNVILARVIDYINYSNNEEVVSYLREAYADRIMDDKLVNNKEAFTEVTEVTSYTYDDINPSKSIDELMEMRNSITSVVESENSKKPYIKPISKSIIETIIVDLTGLYYINKDKRYKALALNLTQFKSMFMDKRGKSYSGTAYKPVYKNKNKLDLLVYGLDFLIKEMSSGRKPESWRVF